MKKKGLRVLKKFKEITIKLKNKIPRDLRICPYSQMVKEEEMTLFLYVMRGMNPQLGEIFDTCIWPTRILGPLSNRYGISTTMYGAINHWHLKAWKTGRTEYQAVRNTSSPASCVLTFIKKENQVAIQNVPGFCSCAQTCPIHAIPMEALCGTGIKL